MGATILLVEDELTIQEVLHEVLVEEGYEVAAVWNGAEALGWLQLHCPDLILSDIMMPVLDGLRLCQLVHADPATCHVPVMLMSAIAQPIPPEICSPHAFVAKPFTLDHVLRTIAQIVAPT